MKINLLILISARTYVVVGAQKNRDNETVLVGKLALGGGGGGEMSAKNVKIFFPQYNKIVSISKRPFYNPQAMKYYNVLAYFSLDYENCPFTKLSW